MNARHVDVSVPADLETEVRQIVAALKKAPGVLYEIEVPDEGVRGAPHRVSFDARAPGTWLVSLRVRGVEASARAKTLVDATALAERRLRARCGDHYYLARSVAEALSGAERELQDRLLARLGRN